MASSMGLSGANKTKLVENNPPAGHSKGIEAFSCSDVLHQIQLFEAVLHPVAG